MRNDAQNHETYTYIQMQKGSYTDMEPLSIEYPQNWGILAEKGCQGSVKFARVIHSKNTRNGRLKSAEKRENKKTSSDRIIVEIIFGRLTQLWEEMYCQCRWSEQLYNMIAHFCVAMTNYHIFGNQLCYRDQGFYRKSKSKHVAGFN